MNSRTLEEELLEVLNDTNTDYCNISLRGFLLGNYSRVTLEEHFPLITDEVFPDGLCEGWDDGE